jgi:hypothetical protein
MLKQADMYTLEREKALADGLRDVASELRLIDALDWVRFIQGERFGNIKALVNSSTELFFKPGTISFGASGDVDLAWGSAPTVGLDMEFHNKRITVYFRLLLQALQAGIEIDHISFENGSGNPDENTKLLIEAIADARLSPVPAFGALEALSSGISGTAVPASSCAAPLG